MKRNLFWLALFFLIIGLAPAFAENSPATIPASQPQIQLSFAPLVKKTAPAVVNIYTRKVVRQRVVSPFMDDPIFRHFFEGSVPQGMTRQRLENSLGSGVVVRSDGLIVTCNHVIAGADQITVGLSDKREFEATVLAADERADLAVLKINVGDKTLPALALRDSDEAEVGDLVLAIGNPFGVGQTVTSGIISATARTTIGSSDLNYFIQTDAAINPGNSGGALVTMDGKLVGINASIYSRDGGNLGIGFAVPANMVQVILKSVAEGHKKVVRPWTGIEGQAVTAELAASLNLPQPTGLLVNALHSSSPAKKAGLRVGDVIVALNGKAVEDPDAFRFRIATLPIGTEAQIEIWRAGQKQELNFPLIAPPEDTPRQETRIKGENPLSGAVIANISPALIEENSLQGITDGVVIIKLIGNSPASNLGLQVGDLVLGINGRPVKSVNDALALLQVQVLRWQITLQRGEQKLNIVVGG